MKRTNLSFRLRVYPVDAGTDSMEWVAEVPDLPGCVGAGLTPGEAVARVMEAERAWLEIALEDGKTVPTATSLPGTEYQGKITLKLPRTLHRELALLAEEEDIALEQYLVYLILKGLSRDPQSDDEPGPGKANLHQTGGRMGKGIDLGRTLHFRPGIPAGKITKP